MHSPAPCALKQIKKISSKYDLNGRIIYDNFTGKSEARLDISLFHRFHLRTDITVRAMKIRTKVYNVLLLGRIKKTTALRWLNKVNDTCHRALKG